MAKGTTFDNDLLKLIFQAVNIALIADNAATTPLTNLFIALHTADPSAGDQTTNEIAYTGYGRVAVARTAGGWTIATNTFVNAGTITFGACTAGSATAAWVSIGTVTTGGTGKVLYAGALTASLAISNGITPSFAASALSGSES